MEKQKNEDVPMIELHKVEMSMVLASKMRRFVLVIATILVLASIIGNVVIVDIFTSKYNSRTKDWLDTVQVLVDKITGAEVNRENSISLQQFSPP